MSLLSSVQEVTTSSCLNTDAYNDKSLKQCMELGGADKVDCRTRITAIIINYLPLIIQMQLVVYVWYILV